ncbi:hypothetical protein BC937DRAFT_87901 [Endogone sp. FLAS-F59071]|nr:hypothetical protein BC937DRAFT_87901 [Endogone sp. FLAS-F59071]|eukprot:RUS19171.1 hypothetical protein BC937DRAFT_87901 [Endogone sp. FLAS-F59071]
MLRPSFRVEILLSTTTIAAVDENGDVYQWGEEFFGIRPAPGDSIDLVPEQTLRGKNIVTVALSQDKLFALSSTGALYILPSSKRQQQQQQQQASKLSPSSTIANSTSWWPFGGGDSSKLTTHALEVNLDRPRKGERITAIATGSHHLLALTSAGRVFSAATDVNGNRSGQLGLSHMNTVGDVGELHEVRGDLEGMQVLEVACGHEHSVVRSADGRAFTFGANTWGQILHNLKLVTYLLTQQLAQGDYNPSNASLPNPSEVTLLYNPVPGSSRQGRPHTHRCVRVAAGGANTFFVIDKLDRASRREVTELYSAGMGQYGQLGNSQWTHMQGVPVMVHTVSGLMEYNESVNKTIPIGVHDIAPGATHVAAVLDNGTNVAEAVDTESPHYGYDVLTWGRNIDWQIGNGRRNNIASPVHPLPLNAPAPSPAGKGAPRASKTAPTSPANRLQLAPETRIRNRNGSQVIVGQKIVAGTGSFTPVSYSTTPIFPHSDCPDLKLITRGKVRDLYEVDDKTLLFVATDRISAFDVIMKDAIPSKGKILTQLSVFWFHYLRDVLPNHLITANIDEMPDYVRKYRSQLEGRSMLVRRLQVLPIESIVRGYLAGSGWAEYKRKGTICDIELPAGLVESEKLPEPLFTPSTKAEIGDHGMPVKLCCSLLHAHLHSLINNPPFFKLSLLDENIHPDKVVSLIGVEYASSIADAAVRLYIKASQYAAERGIIIADTKFEFGVDSDRNVVLADEVLTPDSSRFWPATIYGTGRAQDSFDKQYLRDYLESVGFDKKNAVKLPDDVVSKTLFKYVEAYRLLTGEEPAL